MWKAEKGTQQELDENVTRLQWENVTVFQQFGYVSISYCKQTNSFYTLVECNSNSCSSYIEHEQTCLLLSNAPNEWHSMSISVHCTYRHSLS